METPNIIGVHVQRVEDDCVYYETAYAVSDELHEQVAESLNYGDNWSLTCLGAAPSSKMNSGGTSNWLMERNLSGDNHWLEDLAQQHATVATESAGMETRLLQEIARLQARIEVLEAGLRSIEVNAPRVEPVKMHPTDFQARYQFWIAGKVARDLLKDSQS